MKRLLAGACAAAILVGLRVDSIGTEQDRTVRDAARVRLGYSPDASDRQRTLETRFRDSVSPARIFEFHRAVTRQPHLAGTPGGAVVADVVKNALIEAGLDVDVFEYRAYLSLPKEVSVDLMAPVKQTLRVSEPVSPIPTL